MKNYTLTKIKENPRFRTHGNEDLVSSVEMLSLQYQVSLF